MWADQTVVMEELVDHQAKMVSIDDTNHLAVYFHGNLNVNPDHGFNRQI